MLKRLLKFNLINSTKINSTKTSTCNDLRLSMTLYLNTQTHSYKSSTKSSFPPSDTSKKDVVSFSKDLSKRYSHSSTSVKNTELPSIVHSKLHAPCYPTSPKPTPKTYQKHINGTPSTTKTTILPAVKKIKPSAPPLTKPEKPSPKIQEAISKTQDKPPIFPDGMCIFIDSVERLDEKILGAFSDNLICACNQSVPIITPPNLLSNLLRESSTHEINLRLKTNLYYDVYRHSLSNFIALLPKKIKPVDLRLTGFEKTRLEDYKPTITTYKEFKSIFDDTPCDIKPSIVVYIGGHGNIAAKATANLSDVNYCDFVEHLDKKVYQMPVCFVSSCQPHGVEPKISGVLLRRGLPNITTGINKDTIQFDKFFKNASRLDFNTTPTKINQQLQRLHPLVDGDDIAGELSIWNPKMAITCGKPLPKKERILMTFTEMRKCQIELHNLKGKNIELHKDIREFILFPMKLPFGIIMKGHMLPAIFSNFGGSGMHFITYIESSKATGMDEIITNCFEHSKMSSSKATSTISHGHHLYFIKHIKIRFLNYYNVTIFVSPNKAIEWDGTHSSTTAPNTTKIRKWIKEALPYSRSVLENSAGQESIKAFMADLQEEFWNLNIH